MQIISNISIVVLYSKNKKRIFKQVKWNVNIKPFIILSGKDIATIVQMKSNKIKIISNTWVMMWFRYFSVKVLCLLKIFFIDKK